MRCFLAAILVVSPLFAQTNVQRPHILGIAHVAFRVSDIATAGAFYESFLGYVEPFALSDGSEKTTIAFVKVNDEQYVELLQGDARSQGQLDHFALYTDDLVAMREYILGGWPNLRRHDHVSLWGRENRAGAGWASPSQILSELVCNLF